MPDAISISSRVKAQYEAFPYPNYTLLLRLRAQEAYASHSLFAARLLEQSGQRPAIRQDPSRRVLLAGCGDTFPYLAACWEPRRHSLVAVDLSGRNLQRARLRCWSRLRSITWQQGNLEDPTLMLPHGLAHIDSYGVLHHLADPARVLQRFEELLLPGGTARIMVYNREARRWIHHLQKAFGLLRLSAFDAADLEIAQVLLASVARVSPILRDRFTAMGLDGFTNASRLVDTFFHAREAQLGLNFWLESISRSGLKIIGVLDRYAELDDLPNPLLQVPSFQAWQERIEDRRFENNFELYLAKPGPMPSDASDRHAMAEKPVKLPAWHFLKTPPKSWFEYPETQSIPWLTRLRIGSHFRSGLCGKNPVSRHPLPPLPSASATTAWADAWAGSLPSKALQRLGRLGALFPDDFRSLELRQLLMSPLHDTMEIPDFAQPGEVFQHREIRADVQGILKRKNQPMPYLEAVMHRLEAAQRP